MSLNLMWDVRHAVKALDIKVLSQKSVLNKTAPVRPLNYSFDSFMWQASVGSNSSLSHHHVYIRKDENM